MIGDFKEAKRYNITKGEVFFKRGELLENICIVISGEVCAKNDYISMKLGTGAVLGLMDMQSEEYILDYEAVTPVTLLPFNYLISADINKIFKMGSDYQELVMNSLFLQFRELYGVYEDKFKPYVTELRELNLINELDDCEVDARQCEYIMEISNMPRDVIHQLFTKSPIIPIMHIEIVTKLVGEINHAACEMNNAFDNENKKDKLLLGLEQVAQDIEDDTDFVQEDTLEDNIDNMDNEANQKAGNNDDIEEPPIDNIKKKIAIESLNNSINQIVEYSGISKEKAAEFDIFINRYNSLKHPNSVEDDVRMLKNNIAGLFYEIYEQTFFKAYKDKENGNKINRVVELFLEYGYMDERSFEEAVLVQLYYLEDNTSSKYNVYTIFEWLCEIYKGNREPSKSEFDLDYKENLREMKKSRQFTIQQEQEYLNNQENKVHYEISNLFRITNKLSSGEITRFCPVLNQRSFSRKLKEILVTRQKIEKAMDNIISIDYSLFYREHLYVNEEKGIEKIYIMKEILPDIILMPNVGLRGIMWQDISEKRRDNPARFVFPIFTVEELENMLINVAAAFRWELCRTVQGNYWNDIREHSLTSEYCDYLQFYRKNKELSESVKEKVKNQYQKCRNSYREMFTKDYETWIKYETKGSVRLNKCARRILYLYCPLSKEYRDKISSQPVYADAAVEFTRNRTKKLKDVKNQYKLIENSGGQIDDVMLEKNLDYYEK